ncbi:rod shape-determining protein RodA [Candidatus Saccharibacteria bacterium]|nr:rod shape-determining protein RodA [Candidatus Saccharibacteria bacterium]
MKQIRQRIDWIVLTTSLLITAIGLLVLYSSGIKATSVSSQIDATRQFLYAGIGLVGMWVMIRTDYRVLKSYALLAYIIMLALLIAVEFVGTTALGAQRWINVGFFQFQPSEFAKLLFIIVLAAYYSRVYEQSRHMRYLIISAFILIIPMMIVVSQPDLGTGLVFLAIWLAMTLASQIRKRYLVIAGGIGAGLLPVAYQFLAPYQKNRIQVLLNPAADKLGSGYNVTQAMIAVGSGGWFGRGLSAGSQSQLNFLPSQHTDFIFAVLAEKLGFVGSTLTIILFLVLIGRIFLISLYSVDRFGSFLCVGIASMILFHVMINIGMNMGIMPVTGIPLPLISAGGTSMLTMMVTLGIVLSVSSQRETNRRLKDVPV